MNPYAQMPFAFWSVVAFVFGSMVGSFLNVCIHRMPIGLSVVKPPSHCPHCKYSIPWFLNIPLLTWLVLRGKCKNCSAPISIRYFLVELLTGLAFLIIWNRFAPVSIGVAICYWILIAGFIVATFIDLEHFIIPDEITIGGTVLGIILSFFVPQLHGQTSISEGILHGFLGALAGGGIVYGVLRLGKLMFGKQRIELEPGSRVLFMETGIQLPDREVPFEELFYRDSDTVFVQGRTIELPERCYWNQVVELSPTRLKIGEDEFKPEDIPRMEIVADQIVLPREAMGFGDVKFMAAIGAFLGWKAVLFSLMVSSMIGAAAGLLFVALRKQEWSARIPYGPYIAAAATIWIFWGPQIFGMVFR